MTQNDTLARDPDEHSARPNVLVLLGCFATGVEATGPNQNLLGMVGSLGQEYRFRVAAAAMPQDEPGAWQTIFGVEQMPLEIGPSGAVGLRDLITKTPHNLIITNGFFDRQFTLPLLVLRKFGKIPRTPVLLCVHGEFSPGALAIRSGRKRAWISACRHLGMLDGVTLSATSELEASEIRGGMPFWREAIAITPVIRAVPPQPAFSPRAQGNPLRTVFLSRIDTKKNLEYALDRLEEFGQPVDFDIYGPVSDAHYWQQCQARIARLPDRVRVTHRGTLSQAQVIPKLANYDLFFLPTWGENYGHAIVDALCAGTPILISDQTPWRGLADVGAGWDLPLSDSAAFIAALQEVAARDPGETLAARRAARRYAEAALDVAGAAGLTRDWLEKLRR